MTSKITKISSSRCFKGYQNVFAHESKVLKCTMNFGVYVPPQAEKQKVPVLYYLSGLTCTEQNFITKSGHQRFASQYGFLVVSPDTSPRGNHIPGNDDKWNVGTGAGYYINATQTPWKTNYQMYTYITEELPEIIEQNFPILIDKQGVMGHSMGGTGALLLKLKNPNRYKSISLLAPVCDVSKSSVFIEAFSLYLDGSPDDGSWDEWNPTALVKQYKGPKFDLLIDQGLSDEFLPQLNVWDFVEACEKSGISVKANKREGYDHGYYFISTFIENHFKHHADVLS